MSKAWLFEPVQAAIPIRGTNLAFPVRRVYCVGQNYAAHAIEMGNTTRKPPFFFQKPADAVVTGATANAVVRIPYPLATKSLHYEGELVVAIGADAITCTTREAASKLVYGYAVGVDLTRRDIQAEAKKQGRPWEMGKAFDRSAPVSWLVRAAEAPLAPSKGKLTLEVNQVTKQSSDIDKMIWDVPDMILELSKYVELKRGDLIFTGTPEGVGEVKAGETIRVAVEQVAELTVVVEAAAKL
jgi:fumarylpyruvate hydrolase